MRELEDELDRARNEVDAARKSKDGRLREVIGEKSGKPSTLKVFWIHTYAPHQLLKTWSDHCEDIWHG